MNTQDRFPLGLTGWISLLFKELSRVFSSTTVRKHQLVWSKGPEDENSLPPLCTPKVFSAVQLLACTMTWIRRTSVLERTADPGTFAFDYVK